MDKKSRCVNKKLHPYWKTGIYGWLGEEVDDNDYMCCPICGEILAINYWDYSAKYDGDNKCPKCGQDLDYSEIYSFEDTCYFEQLLEIKEDKIADLEAKLEESESESNARYSAWQEEIGECDRLRVALAEKEKEIQSLKLLLDSVDHYKQYHKDANLVILNPENCYADGYKVVIKTDNQTAIAELEKVKDKTDALMFKINNMNYFIMVKEELYDFIDQQIKELKGEK